MSTLSSPSPNYLTWCVGLEKLFGQCLRIICIVASIWIARLNGSSGSSILSFIHERAVTVRSQSSLNFTTCMRVSSQAPDTPTCRCSEKAFLLGRRRLLRWNVSFGLTLNSVRISGFCVSKIVKGVMDADCFLDSWHSIHGIISERNQHHERIYSFQRCRDYRLMHARNQASISRKHPTAAGNFHQDLLNTDCWFEILKLLNTKDRANMKSTSTYIYNCINASTLYCDLTYSCLNASTLYSELTEATMFTRILDRSGNTSNFQQVPVTPETMEGQPFWYLEIRGARNKNNKNMSLSPGIVLIKTMASLSHPRRLTGISIDSVADVALMVLVWKAYLHELRNLRYLTIVACSESLPVEIFKTHKALNGLEYEVDVIDEAVVMDEGKRRMLWIYQSSLPILQPTRPLGARI